MPRLPARWYLALLTVAAAWAAFNCIYVYGFRGPTGVYRIESATLIFVALALPFVALRPQEPPAASNPNDTYFLIALGVTWVACFGALLWFPFLSDDYGFLAAYRTMADVARPFQFYRPGFAVAFAALGRAGGGSQVAFHAASFCLHLASSACVYLLARRVSRGPAIVAAVVFLLNPVQLESVLWVSGLQELLWTFFILAALVCYAGASRPSPGRVAAVTALVACGLASKETAVCVLVLLPAVDLLGFGVKRARAFAWVYVIVGLEVGVYLLLRSRAVVADTSFLVAPSHYFLKQLMVTPYEVFIHPWNQSAAQVSGWAMGAASLAFLGGVLLAAWRGASARALLGPAMIAGSTLPVYSLFFVGPDLAGSRYLYFGAAGFGLVVAEIAVVLFPSPREQLGPAVLLTGLLTVSLAVNFSPWRDVKELVQDMTAAAQSGRDPLKVAEAWTADHPALVFKDGVPDSYDGVWVFRNGYPEFLQRTRP